MKSTHVLGWVLPWLLATGAACAQAPSARETFRQLQSLAGRWEGTYASGRRHSVDYRTTAGGTVVVETWTMSPTRESITMYAMDGDRLLATHYCPQGNQPRLRWTGVDSEGRHRFEFLDGTNLQVADGAHQQRFWIRFDDAAHFERAEHYVANTGDDADAADEDEAVVYTRIANDRTHE